MTSLLESVHENRPIDGKVQLVDRRDVVLARSDRCDRGRADCRPRHSLISTRPNRPSRPGYWMFQANCSADDADDERLVFGRQVPDARRPGGNRVADEQHDLDDRDQHFGGLGELAFRARVARRRIRALAEPDEDEQEERAPADEQHQHQPVHEDRHLIDLGGVRRRLHGHAQPFEHHDGPFVRFRTACRETSRRDGPASRASFARRIR